MSSRFVPLTIALVAGLAAAFAVIESPASLSEDDTGCVTIFREGISGHTGGLATGPDGNLYFTQVLEDQIGVLDPETGDVREIQLPKGTGPRSPIVTSDREMYFTGLSGSIGRYDIRADRLRLYTEGISEGSVPHTPVIPGDGFLYFTEEAFRGGQLGRLDLETGEITETRAGLPRPPRPADDPGAGDADPDAPPRGFPYTFALHGITTGPQDEDLWVSWQDADQIVPFDLARQRFDASRAIQFSENSGPHDVRLGPDNRLYTTLQHGGKIGEADIATGDVREYETDLRPNFTPDAQPDNKLVDIVINADRTAAYATSFFRNELYRLDLSTGEVDTPVCDIPPGGAGLQLVVGPDDHIWYADPIRGAIVRVNRPG